MRPSVWGSTRSCERSSPSACSTPPDPSPSSGLGVYVHIPFCVRRCDYCAFVTWAGRESLAPEYIDAVVAEIGAARDAGRLESIDTVFIGGGTPSLIGAALLERLLVALAVDDTMEVTVECNPESTDVALLNALAGAGVNRISLGVQSLARHVLAGLGRAHEPETARRAVEAVGASGFTNFNVDLIYGGAGELDADWEQSLEGVLAFEPSPPHVSAYALTVEAGTPLASDPTRHPDDDVQADRYLYADERLARAGLSWYEISNFARPGHECRHNNACWAQADYLGFGCAAHSHLAGRRFRNVASVDRYLTRIAAGESAVAAEESLSPAAQRLEALQLMLRTRAGVPSSSLPDREGIEALLVEQGSRVMLSAKGRLLANEVAIRLVPQGE